MKKKAWTFAVWALVLAGLVYLAHATDFFRIAQRIHGQ